MREAILKCKRKHPDWGYKRIAIAVGANKDMVHYYLSPGRRASIRAKTRQRRAVLPLERKVETFIAKKCLRDKTDGFQRRAGSKIKERNCIFTYQDVMRKFPTPHCYLTGSLLDYSEPKEFAFDHIMPATRGGTNSLANLGLLRADVNKMKSNLMVDEFIEICKQVLLHAGFEIRLRGRNSNAPVSKTECG